MHSSPRLIDKPGHKPLPAGIRRLEKAVPYLTPLSENSMVLASKSRKQPTKSSFFHFSDRNETVSR